jgi:hypothetical protein
MIVRIKALKIVGIGLIMWGLTLLWPEFNLLLLASSLQPGWLVGAGMMLVILYFWSGRRRLASGQGMDLYDGEPYWSKLYASPPAHSRPTRPYVLPRTPDHHSRATRPMPQV